jgi:tRNA A37 threonylcarbamoyladenosine dehydratase
MDNSIAFSRTEILIGNEKLEKLKKSHVVIVGIGGVGGYATEALVRAGIETFTLIDHDTISESNINRQIIATVDTVDKPKVDIMKERILAINPNATVHAIKSLFNQETAVDVLPENPTYVLDAIDMISAKLHLIELCLSNNIPIISSMGTGNKLDPTTLQLVDLAKTYMCPLAKIMRKELRRRGIKHLDVVYSPAEPLVPADISETEDRSHFGDEGDSISAKWRRVPGSISCVPAVAGMFMSSKVIQKIIEK